ncbi:MAG: DUF3467 domain-containing protein [Anaerolineales bacterium]|nr:DUF3467 domain-containing protein [Anaerolineales bacterium]
MTAETPPTPPAEGAPPGKPAEGPPAAPATIPLELPANLEPAYSNFALISHSPSEFIFDFARALPSQRARVVTRLVMTPLNAKLLLRALADNLARYEAQHGEVVVPTHLADQLFKPPKPE